MSSFTENQAANKVYLDFVYIFNKNLLREVHDPQECGEIIVTQVRVSCVDVVHDGLHGGLGASLHGYALGLTLHELRIVEASFEEVTAHRLEGPPHHNNLDIFRKF